MFDWRRVAIAVLAFALGWFTRSLWAMIVSEFKRQLDKDGHDEGEVSVLARICTCADVRA